MRLRDRQEFWDARDECDAYAARYGGHWCVCWLERGDWFQVYAIEDAETIPADATFRLYSTRGGRLRRDNPIRVARRQDRVCRRLCEVVAEIGGHHARRWSLWLDAATEAARREAIQTSRHAAVIWAFKTLVTGSR